MTSMASIITVRFGVDRYNPLHISLSGSKQKSRVRFRDVHKHSAEGQRENQLSDKWKERKQEGFLEARLEAGPKRSLIADMEEEEQEEQGHWREGDLTPWESAELTPRLRPSSAPWVCFVEGKPQSSLPH